MDFSLWDPRDKQYYLQIMQNTNDEQKALEMVEKKKQERFKKSVEKSGFKFSEGPADTYMNQSLNNMQGSPLNQGTKLKFKFFPCLTTT